MAGQKTPEISALDIRLLLREWELSGAFIRKIYQAGQGKDWQIVLEIFVQQKGAFYMHVYHSFLSLDKQKGAVQEAPSGFCMSLRKHLSGKRIEKVEQHGFDRILEMSAGGVKLILEFVPPGNVILTDSEGVIISALSTKRWRDREIRVRSLYQHPPNRPNPFSMDLPKFAGFFRQDKKAAAVLASDMGFGPEYANTICSEAKVRPDKSAFSLEEKEIRRMFEAMSSLNRIKREEPAAVVVDRDAEKAAWILKQRAQALEKWKAAEKLARDRADAIYRKFDTVQALLEKLSTKKDAGFEPIEKKDGLHITAKLDGTDVPLDLKKTAQENAAFYYDQAKKAKRKVASLESLRPPEPRQPDMSQPEPSEEYPDQGAHREWYQKFKWFRSSDGILVVAGKNAEQNEMLIKSHAEPDEWCFHADIRGAAFTIIKSGKDEPPEQTKKEAAEFAAANSKAWTKSYGAISVLSVQRKDLSKSTPVGMNLPKGSFIVTGKKVWYRSLPLRMAVGATPEGEIRSGPESAIRKLTGSMVMLVPGGKKASDLSRDMKSELLSKAKQKDLPDLQKLSLEELGRHVPFGFGAIARE